MRGRQREAFHIEKGRQCEHGDRNWSDMVPRERNAGCKMQSKALSKSLQRLNIPANMLISGPWKYYWTCILVNHEIISFKPTQFLISRCRNYKKLITYCFSTPVKMCLKLMFLPKDFAAFASEDLWTWIFFWRRILISLTVIGVLIFSK